MLNPCRISTSRTSVTGIRRRLLLAFPAALLVRNAKADLYDDYINSKTKRPFVSFLARNTEGSSGKPGHSYVAAGVEVDNGMRVYERIFGYYPKSETALEEVKAVFTKVAGDIRYKLPDVTWTVELYVPADEAAHKAALGVMETWQKNDPKYQLFANSGKNCSSFAAEVAKAIGLKVPGGAGSKLPVMFISELRDMNRKP